MDERALGRRLQLARKRAGLTQQELCQKAGISYSTLAKIERGAIRSPSVFTVASISAITETSVEDLLDLDSKRLKSPAPLDAKKRSKTGVTFVYFDVNGTLLRFFEKAFTEIARQSHRPVEIVETLFWRYDGAACRGSMTTEEVEKIFANELDIGDFNWLEYYLQNIEPTPGAAELVEWAAKHYEVGLLTNNWLGYTEALIEKKLLPDVKYTAVVESAKVGAAKPEARIYETARELANVGPDEILLVDDTPPYLKGAEQAGWHTLWFTPDNPEISVEQVKTTLEF